MLLIPGFEYIDLGLDGGPYDERAHPKVCWHMTQGSTWQGAERAFKPYPPHALADPATQTRRQYIDANRHSYSLRGAESDDEYVFQVEVVGYSEAVGTWPAEYYQWLGLYVVKPIRETLGVPDVHLRFYGPGAGFILASPNSPIRLSDTAFRNFSGHLGHQHVPAPDEHWDPGAFRLENAIAASYPPIPQEEDMSMAYPVTLPPTRKDGESEKIMEISVPLVWQGGITGATQVWVEINTGNRPMKIAVAEWQINTDHGQDVYPMLPAGTVIPPLGNSGGKQAPAGAYQLIIDYDSPVGGSVKVEAR